MGHVYKAFNPRLHREIAIKVAAERSASDSTARFEQSRR